MMSQSQILIMMTETSLIAVRNGFNDWLGITNDYCLILYEVSMRPPKPGFYQIHDTNQTAAAAHCANFFPSSSFHRMECNRRPFLESSLAICCAFLQHTLLRLAKESVPFFISLTFLCILSLQDKVGEVVKRTGVLVLYPGICITAAFISAALIPIPAIRAPMLAGGLLMAFNALSMLLLFPALLSLDLKRSAAKKLDVLCCYNAKPTQEKESQHNWTLKYFVTHYWSLWLVRTPMKIATLMAAFILTCIGLYGLVHFKQGLNLSEVVPQNTSAHDFLQAQHSYFGFYNMYAVTKGNFEYPQNQAILYDYHNAFVRVGNIIKDDDGGLEEFWLPLFRNWLLRLQNAFDDDFSQGNIYEYGWHSNASSDAILAYKLLVQTGHVGKAQL